MSCYLVGYGVSLPKRVVTNEELAPRLGVAPEWIESNSGIRERRWVEAGESTSDLAAAAVRDALLDANFDAHRIDYLVGCTLSPDYQVPGIAPLVQRKLDGCRPVPSIDLRAGCAAILYALQLALGLIASGAAETIVCFGAEAQSKGLDLSPESAELSMLFGDGAGAVVVTREMPSEPTPGMHIVRLEDILIASDGAFAEDLMVRAPGTGNGERWIDEKQLAAGVHHGVMNGRSVILHAVRKLADAAGEILRRNDLVLDQIDLVIPHQANANLLRALSKKLAINEDRIVMNVHRFGNTSGASPFLTLWQAHRDERLRAGARILILAFGAGFTWGACLCRVM